MAGSASIDGAFTADPEKLILAVCLRFPDDLEIVRPSLEPSDFHNQAYRKVYQAICAVTDAGTTVDLVSVTAQLKLTGQLNSIGGQAAMVDIIDSTWTGASVKQYIRIIKEDSRERRLRGVSAAATRALDNHETTSDVITKISEEIANLTQADSKDIRSASDIALETMERLDAYKLPGTDLVIKTPFSDLNRIVSGFRPTEYFVIAARPGFGKSALAHAIALHAAGGSGIPVGILTLEMSEHEVVERMACAIAGVDSKNLREGRLTNEEYDTVVQCVTHIGSMPIYFDQSCDTNPVKMRATVRRMAKMYGCKMIILDHIQLVDGPKRSENRQQEMTAISRACKIAAKESCVCMVVLSQLNRATEGRTSGRPILADLRESGSIEQDADAVMFIYYQHFYDKAAERGKSELIIAKQRNGPTESCPIVWQPQFTRFQNYTSEATYAR